MSPPLQNETHAQKLARKSEEAPFVPIGCAGLLGALVYGAYAYKNKGDMPTSVYLMHLRVRAQAMVVGAMTFGVSYWLIKDWLKKSGSQDNHKHDKSH